MRGREEEGEKQKSDFLVTHNANFGYFSLERHNDLQLTTVRRNPTMKVEKKFKCLSYKARQHTHTHADTHTNTHTHHKGRKLRQCWDLRHYSLRDRAKVSVSGRT